MNRQKAMKPLPPEGGNRCEGRLSPTCAQFSLTKPCQAPLSWGPEAHRGSDLHELTQRLVVEPSLRPAWTRLWGA